MDRSFNAFTRMVAGDRSRLLSLGVTVTTEATVRRKVFSLCHMQEHHSGQGQWKVGATGGWGLYP